VVQSGMVLERAADWGRRDGFAAALRKNLGSAQVWGKTRRSAVILDNALGPCNVLSHSNHCTYD